MTTLRAVAVCVIVAATAIGTAAQDNQMLRINVVTNTPVTDAILEDLATHGMVRDVIVEINAVLMQARRGELPTIRALPYVAAANPDAERLGAPVDTVSAEDFLNGLSAWDQDAIDVTVEPFSSARAVPYDGAGVYVAVLDTGLVDLWRQYFPEERIATHLAKAFSGGGQDQGNVSEPTKQWEHDNSSHGTHVTSTILGYSLRGVPINGTAPLATVIPVKVLNQAGFGWSSMIAAGIVYVTNLKIDAVLGSPPLVINMSLGGPELDAVEQAALDYAVANGVIVVAAAGNEGDEGMGFPAAYPPVISAAAAGWIGQWQPGDDGNTRNWWINDDVAEPADVEDFYVADFSSREKAGQDLDVTAPGYWTVGPFQLQSGTISYFFLAGTSMASPHVAGIAALLMQKDPTLAQADVEAILESAALPMDSGCRTVLLPDGTSHEFCWDASKGDADGEGFITADAALAAADAMSTTTTASPGRGRNR